MSKPRWQRILDLEHQARTGCEPLSEQPPMPSKSIQDPLVKQMASDLRAMRRMQSFDFFAPGIAFLLLIGLVWFILGR
ncbi:hypothetical protein [Bradyrhizobium ottawaense]|uniref:Uncharacterized protein n=1 Tax=Bradyrhizobium ottawaense TaxID=931866 RepID=A0ABY0QH61_9BRAD|nr:hypothetical protein [Bradyrhizobium ottawaense]SDK40856.1 hypothetical protein SAMN05444163_8042 [Bradyrhizobium ottawaense]